MIDNKKRNKFSRDVEKGMVQISMLCMLINRRTDKCAFFNDTAHCEYIEVSVRKSKKDYDQDRVDFQVSYNRDGKLDSKGRIDRMDECIKFLQNILINDDIDFSSLTKNYETVLTGYTL